MGNKLWSRHILAALGIKLGAALFVALLLFPASLFAIDASSRYRSPRNPERKVRRSTDLIILHTTEAPSRSSLNKLSDRGEAHYCVTEEGTIYRIVDRDKEAFHAGRSMWRGKEDVDKFSIGIECVGYHDKPMGTVQLVAIRNLVKELQSMYGISDDCVIAHSHVAYGAPNKWHRCKHRGRKRCGMQFAMPSVRKFLGLKSRPAYDPDVRARRLVSRDPYLDKVLYGNIDTMASKLGSPPPKSTSGSWLNRVFSKSSSKSPTTVASPSPKPKRTVAPPKQVTAPPKPKIISVPKTIAELKAGGWVQHGRISKMAGPYTIVGKNWNSANTYYTNKKGEAIPGNKINPKRLESGMGVWIKK